MKAYFVVSFAALAVLLLVRPISAQIVPFTSPGVDPPKAPSTLEEVVASAPFRFPPEVVKQMQDNNQSADIAQSAAIEAAKGNWAKAVPDYQKALALWPGNQIALYGMGEYSLTKNDLKGAISYYRQVMYTCPDTPPTLRVAFAEPNAYRVMEYAVLLSQAGQQDEAISVYQHGAKLLNYLDGRPRLKLMLPDFGTSTGQIAYTPQRLQALAQVGWAIDHVDFDQAGAWARLQKAVALYPNSPVPYFYRATHEITYNFDSKGAKADFDSADQRGNAAEADAVQWQRHFFHHALGEDEAVGKP